VAIVSALAAERFWPGESPLGKRLRLTLMSEGSYEVVGVVGEIKTDQLDERQAQTAVYLPFPQVGFGGAALAVRTSGDPMTLSRAVVSAVHSLDPEQPVLDIMTMERVVDESLGQRRFAMLLLSAFAALALTLASVGIYSVLAYVVRQRVREIGICLALGAPTRDVLRMVLAEGLKPTLLGVGLGLAGAAWLVRLMGTLLFGVGARDPGTYAAVTAIVVGVGLVAMLLPAFRATRVDPITTLRAE
jgi:ABC-type antimicrobial peptide transport system permease subunit